MSQHLPALNPRRVLRALQRAGFVVHHVKGSHHVLRHAKKPHLRVVLPFHNKDLKRRTLISIIKDCELSVEEFLALL